MPHPKGAGKRSARSQRERMTADNSQYPGTIVTKTTNDKARLAVTGVNTAERPAPEPAGFRIVTVSFLSAVVGLIARCIAFLLYKLIGLFNNISSCGHFAFSFGSPRFSHLGPWVIGIPVIGGLIVGVMAKY